MNNNKLLLTMNSQLVVFIPRTFDKVGRAESNYIFA